MKKIYSILCLLLVLLPARAEIIVLQSGQTLQGEIVLQNEDIVMLRDKDGHKYQYPRSQVVEIRQDEVTATIEQVAPVSTSKGNCALRLDFSGGALWIPSLHNGGYGAIDVLIGTRRIGQQRIFVGGGVGYQAAVAGQLYNFLPLTMVVSVPLTSGKHAPELGAALGYGFAIKSPSQGGLVAKLDVNWRYQYSESSALLLGVQARFQQAQVRYMEIVNDKEYTSTLGRNLVSLGLRLALEF